MKNPLLIVCFLTLFFSCKKEETRVLAIHKGDLVLELNTPTAGCANCQKIMENGLSKVKGVQESILNLNTKKVAISYSPTLTDSIKLKNQVNLLVKQFPCK